MDRLTKYKEFVLYKESNNTKKLLYAFNKIIINRHKLPDKIISDRNKLFISKF
jgi:hypothetical protein